MTTSKYNVIKNAVVVFAATVAGAAGYKIGTAGFEKAVPAAVEKIRIGRAFVKLVGPSSEEDDDEDFYDDDDED